MFTGIVEETGIVERIKATAKAIELTVRAKICARGLKIGDSLAVNGCCLTVVKLSAATISAWAEILIRVPGSKLVLKHNNISDIGARAFGMKILYTDLLRFPAKEKRLRATKCSLKKLLASSDVESP